MPMDLATRRDLGIPVWLVMCVVGGLLKAGASFKHGWEAGDVAASCHGAVGKAQSSSCAVGGVEVLVFRSLRKEEVGVST